MTDEQGGKEQLYSGESKEGDEKERNYKEQHSPEGIWRESKPLDKTAPAKSGIPVLHSPRSLSASSDASGSVSSPSSSRFSSGSSPISSSSMEKLE